ncbi:MAG: hypothetical protein LBJ43_02420 [Propionibacteriaceae bacterium]|nr:hypothetical protein [Propionibacteriaceae bacterium]
MFQMLRIGARRAPERGVSVSVFTVIAVAALLIAGGLAMDGAAAARAHRQVEAAAAQLARRGADAGAVARIVGTDSTQSMLQAARGASGNYPGIAQDVRISGTQLVVRTTAEIDTTFLQFIGVRKLRVNGYAVADLVPTRPN